MEHSDSIGKLSEALSKAQGALEGAVENSVNPFFKSKYSDLTSIWKACRKPLTDNGLSVIQTCQSETADIVIIETMLCHTSGEWVKGKLAMKPIKTDPQAIGSCITYARRYSLAAIAGVSPEDDDAESTMKREKNKSSAMPPKKTETKDVPTAGGASDKQKKLIWVKLKNAGITSGKEFCTNITRKESSDAWVNEDIQEILEAIESWEGKDEPPLENWAKEVEELALGTSTEFFHKILGECGWEKVDQITKASDQKKFIAALRKAVEEEKQ
ncbi:MAG TPA: hypothetical protein ENH85_00320 [Candidatus Scalindua sp.]|nr:hypothetical protein [Candidatus Scalindua sp.]